MDHRLQITGNQGVYTFLYNSETRGLCLTQWPDGQKAMRIISCGLPQAIDKAQLAAKNYVRYVESEYQTN
jgi:hypothetical protein